MNVRTATDGRSWTSKDSHGLPWAFFMGFHWSLSSWSPIGLHGSLGDFHRLPRIVGGLRWLPVTPHALPWFSNGLPLASPGPYLGAPGGPWVTMGRLRVACGSAVDNHELPWVKSVGQRVSQENVRG